ncbi:MAG: hypothetical protein WCR74_21765 [Betaproteobacteria bacterium]
MPVQTPDDSPTKRSGIPSSIAACSQARFISVRGSAGAPAAWRACRLARLPPGAPAARCAHHTGARITSSAVVDPMTLGVRVAVAQPADRR